MIYDEKTPSDDDASLSTKPIDPTGILRGPAELPRAYPTQDDNVIVNAFMEKRQFAKDARKARETEWEYNNLYVKGEQLIIRNKANGDSLRVVVEDDSKQKYVVDNACRPIASAYIGKHIRVIPGVEITPPGQDQDDIQAAELYKSYLDFVFHEEEFDVKYKRAVEYLPSFGTAIFQVAWDHMKGRHMAWCEQCQFVSESFEPGMECPYCAEQIGALQQEQEMLAAQGAAQGLQPPEIMPPPPAPALKPMTEGAVSILLHDIRDYHQDPGAIEIQGAQWCFVERALPVSVIRMRFPEAAAKVICEEGLYNDRFVRYGGGSWDSAKIETQFLKDYAKLYEYHEMPTAEFKEGRLLYIANGMVLHQGPNPYVKKFGRLPFFCLRGARNPGEFYGHAWMSDTTSRQREFNKLQTQMRTHRELTLNPQYIIEVGSGMSMDSVDTISGKVIKKVRGASDPRVLERPPLPQYVELEYARMLDSMKQKAGVTDLELGMNAGGQSGRHAAIEEAQSSETIAPIILENSREIRNMGKCILKIAECYESPLKRWQIVGHSKPKTYLWAICKPGWDVRLDMSDILSQNKAMRLQQQMELLQLGAYTDPETLLPDMKAFAADTGLRLPAALADYKTSEYANAAAIPDRVARGENVMPQPWDDANIRAEVLLKWLRADGANADPNVKGIVAQLWLMYAQAMRPTVQAMGALPMAAPAGQPGQPGTPPGQGTPFQGQGPGRQPEGNALNIVKQADQSAENTAQARHEN